MKYEPTPGSLREIYSTFTDDELIKMQTVERQLLADPAIRAQSVTRPVAGTPLLTKPEGATEYDLAREYRLGSGNRVLIVANEYPDHDRLYANGFVHQRVKFYQQRGVECDVFVFSRYRDPSIRHFDGVRILTGYAADLEFLLHKGAYDSIAVHFLNAHMWSVLGRMDNRTRIVVFVHGYEAQRWIRRDWMYTDREQLRGALQGYLNLKSFWHHIFNSAGRNFQFVFVSDWFMWSIMEDMEIVLPHHIRDVIPNVIDTDFFTTDEKEESQRSDILLIRSFGTRKYANDQAVAAIVELNRRGIGNEMRFTLIGDGGLFEGTVAPVRDCANVRIEQRFLTAEEILVEHRRHGVMLTPTRMDSQGVSRDEAMSSGLVPVTSDVAAVPEFVDEQSGFLCSPEDPIALADAMETLFRRPELFTKMSRAAAARVRATLSPDHTIDRELDVLEISR